MVQHPGSGWTASTQGKTRGWPHASTILLPRITPIEIERIHELHSETILGQDIAKGFNIKTDLY